MSFELRQVRVSIDAGGLCQDFQFTGIMVGGRNVRMRKGWLGLAL